MVGLRFAEAITAIHRRSLLTAVFFHRAAVGQSRFRNPDHRAAFILASVLVFLFSLVSFSCGCALPCCL
jgi:hypothetical protein